MDWEATHWNWHAGLVRRAALGLVLYVASVVLICVLTAAAWSERQRLDELAQLAQLHRTMVQAYASLDTMAGQLSNDPSLRLARGAIEPMSNALDRVDVESANAAGVEDSDCVKPWVVALRTLQFAPYSAAGPCDPRGAGSWRCREGQDRLELDSLAEFEKGLHAVVLIESYLTSKVGCRALRDERGVLVTTPAHHAQACRVFGRIGETSWRQLENFATRYTSPEASDISTLRRVAVDRCFPARSPLQTYAPFAARVRGSGAALSVDNFVQLSEKLSEEGRMIVGRQQGVTAGPSGLVSMYLDRNTSAFLLAVGGFLALAYATLNLRKLRALNGHLGLSEREEYRTFTRLSQMFTLPVFRDGPHTSVVDHLIRFLAWSPVAAWGCMLAALIVLAALPQARGSFFVWAMFAFVVLQALMLADFELTRAKVIQGYRSEPDSPPSTSRTSKKGLS